MTRPTGPDRLRASIEGPEAWLWYVGAVRILLLVVVAAGAYALRERVDTILVRFLGLFYLFGVVSCLWYLISLRWTHPSSTPLLTWAQVLVDFGVVAATVGCTGGAQSVFTFLFVIVILEAGLLLGPSQGFIFATLAAGFMVIQGVGDPRSGLSSGKDWWGIGSASATLGYSLLVQVLAYYLTASISGYWNQRLRRMQQFQREILDNMNTGFLITDAEGIVTVQNKAADRILELAEGEAIGRPIQELLRVAGGGECPILTVLRTQRDFTRYEFECLVNENRKKLIGLSTNCMEKQGRLTGIIASFTDLTELAQMREELQRQDRLAAVGELAAGLAHEIRNPVASVQGAVDELRSNMNSPETAARLAGIAIRECDHLNSIISQFLDFAREPRLQRDPFDLCQLLREVATLLQRSCPDRPGITFRMNFPDSVCSVSGDRSQLKQVFINIGNNALEAMGDSGCLTITVERDPVSLLVRFEDEGPGIPPNEVMRVFEPFYTTKNSGVGMGLAVCMRIVTAHDGTIHVASRVGGGAAVTVRLPAPVIRGAIS